MNKTSVALKYAAFSLIELAIVLVILAIIVGGVLAGQTLVHNAELRKLTATAQEWDTAVSAFYLKYKGLPGDFANATTFFGTSSTAECDSGTIARGTPGTCNGDGNGLIIEGVEPYRTFEQLAEAGLISGYYHQSSQNSATQAWTVGVNMPSKSFYNQANAGIWYDTALYGRYAHKIFVGNTSTLHEWDGAYLSIEDTYSVDHKIDDGKPGTGRWVAYDPSDCANCCATTWTASDDPSIVEYQYSHAGLSCATAFLIDDDQ